MSPAEFSDFGKPLPVVDGLTARSVRGSIGTSWWSKRFIAVLESLDIGTRLARGRLYARKGQVISLDVRPGLVSAQVQGSRPTPYQVRIGLPPFSGDVWQRVQEAFAAQALFCAQLLAGDVPTELEAILGEVGVALFPQSLQEIEMTCSCPDWQVPCKHLAATCYLLAERFDADPFEMLHWRGRSREVLLSGLRETADGADSLVAGALAGAGASSPLSAPDLPLDDAFWHPPAGLPSRAPALHVPPDLLLRQLPEPPANLGGRALRNELRTFYFSLVVDDVEAWSEGLSDARG